MTKDYGYPSFDLICKASSGDETSIKEILNFYDAYISKLCLRPFYRENGNVSMRFYKPEQSPLDIDYTYTITPDGQGRLTACRIRARQPADPQPAA